MAITKQPPSFPLAREWVRKIKSVRNLNDMIEDILVRVVDDPDFSKYLRAVHDSQAVEGSLAIDNVMAATKIRETAAKMGSPVAKENLATIVRATNVVLRRYQLDRSARRMETGAPIEGEDDEA